MKVEYVLKEGVHFSAEGPSGIPLEIDGPPDIGGKNRGMRPMELMLMGIGGCTTVDVVHILRKSRCSIQECRTTVTAEREDADPKVFRQIHIHFELTGENLTDSKVGRAVELSAEKYCSASILMRRAGVDISHNWTIVMQGDSDFAKESDESLRPESTLGVHHVALLSSRYEDTRKFYTELMGMDIEWEPDADNVYLSSGKDNLAIHRRSADESSSESRLDHIGFIVSNETQVDAWFQFLKSHEVSIAAEPKTHRDGARSCYVLDPDGTQVQIIHHPPLTKSLR